MSALTKNQIQCLIDAIKQGDQAIIDAITNQSSGVDHELNDSGWICDQGGTNNWIRTITPSVDGVAGAPSTVDSGIPCDQPAPENAKVDVEYVCNSDTGFFDQLVTITTDGVPAAPVVTATTISCAKNEPTQALPLELTCVTVDGVAQYAYPVPLFNQATAVLAGKLWLGEDGDELAGVIVKVSDCDCKNCDECDQSACTLMLGFDTFDLDTLGATDTMAYEILLDGVNQASIVTNYLDSATAGSKASWYADVVAAINAVPGWEIVLETDVLDTDSSSKVNWRVVHTGTSPSTLVIDKEGGSTVYTLASDGAGVITGTTNWDPDSSPFAACV